LRDERPDALAILRIDRVIGDNAEVGAAVDREG
jgi:hypothetical protein